MFGHKVFLRIGELTDASIMGLYKDSYELLNCNYSFAQGIDQKGQPQTDVQGGAFHITLPNLPSPQIMKWMLKPQNKEDGCIVLCDADDTPLSKIFFKNAACIKLNISYMQKGSNYLMTQLILQPEKIIFGTTTFTNKWTNI
jgi:hypothetical protein